MNIAASSSNERLSNLEKKVQEQTKIIQRLSDTIYRTNNVLIDMVQCMFCHQTQQNVLHKHLSELTNNNVAWTPDTLEDTHASGAYPTTYQGNDHEFRITDLENILENIIQEKKLSIRSDEPYLPLLTVDTQDDGSLDSEIIDICNDIHGNDINEYDRNEYDRNEYDRNGNDGEYELTIKSLRLSQLYPYILSRLLQHRLARLHLAGSALQPSHWQGHTSSLMRCVLFNDVNLRVFSMEVRCQ